MSKKSYNLDEFKKEVLKHRGNENCQSEEYATSTFTGSHGKNVSVENIISNNLFLFNFKESYVQDYLNVYKYYKMNNVSQKYSRLQGDLRAISMNLIDNCDVNPIECMLYASKIIDSYLSDLNLLHKIADLVKMLYDRLGQKVYTETLTHIIKYWGKWEPQIKICIMASHKSMDYDLIEYIFNNFFDNFFYKVEVFKCILDSKIELFIPNILGIVYKLNPGEEIDRRIGNEFEKKFLINFSSLEINKYTETLPKPKHPYVLRKLESILNINNQNSFVNKLKLVVNTEHDKKKIIDEAIIALKNTNQNKTDIIYALNLSKIDYAGYKLLSVLNDKDVKSDKWEPMILIDCILCFVFLKYSHAVDKITELSKNKKLKGVARIALCILENLEMEVLIRNYILETDREIIDSYKKGFLRMRRDAHFAKQVRDELVETFTKVLNPENTMLISTSIKNILTLIKIDIIYYPFTLFAVIQELFGFGEKNHLEVKVKVRIQDQLYLLDIIQMVVNDNNKNKYYNFLFYVEKENINITETVKQKANIILNDKYPMEYMGTT